jgi:hypothetical protein
MSLSIFIKSFSSDMDVLPYALRSIARYCKEGVINITVCCDSESDIAHLSKIYREIGLQDVTTILSKVKNKSAGYIDQQIDKLLSFESCLYDNILVVDSDMVFFRDFSCEDFSHHGRILIPYRDWGWSAENMLPPKELLVRLSKDMGIRIFALSHLTKLLFSLNEEKLKIYEISDLQDFDNFRLIKGSFKGVSFYYNSTRSDLLWAYSGLEMGNTPLDTMRVHYMIRKNSLISLRNFIEKKYGSDVISVFQNLEIFPAPSEYQVIGNYLINESYSSSEIAADYNFVPNHAIYESNILRNKFPYVKFNGKSRDESCYEILEDAVLGRYSEYRARYDVIRNIRNLVNSDLSWQWC